MFSKTEAPEAPAPFVPIPGQVMDVPVVELLRRITASSDCGPLVEPDHWFSLFRDKTRHGTFWQLCDVLPTIGFTTPICVKVSTDGEWHLGNGHHRTAAAILLALDSVRVYFTPDEDSNHWEITSPEDEWDDIVPGAEDVDYEDAEVWCRALMAEPPAVAA